MASIAERVKQIVAEQLGVDEDQVTSEASFMDDLGADSLDTVELARQTPDKHLVFFGVGFETTMPATALAIQTAAALGLDNFSVCCVHKTMPAALKALNPPRRRS